jgi:phospholipid transport system transporter-binding protein
MPMAHADRATGLSLHRDGPALHLSGPLDRDAATSAWPALLPLLDGARVLDLAGVTRLDSAGVALLAEAAARITAAGAVPELAGAPAGLADLRAAYRLDAVLAYADSAP